jgi:hypothetical protein
MSSEYEIFLKGRDLQKHRLVFGHNYDKASSYEINSGGVGCPPCGDPGRRLAFPIFHCLTSRK